MIHQWRANKLLCVSLRCYLEEAAVNARYANHTADLKGVYIQAALDKLDELQRGIETALKENISS